MSKVRSYSSEDWKSFEKGVHNFIDQDFVHQKTFSFKGWLEKEREGVYINESIIEKTEGLSGVGQTRFWFTLQNNKSFIARIGTLSNLSLQFDNGITPYEKFSQNFYAGIEVNRSFSERIGKVGLELFKDDLWAFNSRLVYNFSRKAMSLDNKFFIKWRNFKANGFTNIEILAKPTLSKTGLLLSWESATSQTSSFLKIEKRGNDSTVTTKSRFFDTLILGCHHALTNTQKIGLQTRINLHKFERFRSCWRSKEAIWLASEWKLGETTLKAKVNSDLSHALSITNKLGNIGKYSIGFEATEIGSKNKFKFGTQIELHL